MDRLTENKIVLIVRRTRLDELITRFNTIQQARFYVEHSGADFSDYLLEHENYHNAVGRAERVLCQFGRVQMVDRAFLPNFQFGKDNFIVALGQDGLVANTIKYLTGQPVIGVNPDPKRWDGVLLPFSVDDLPLIIPEVFRQGRPIKTVTMAKAELNNGQCLYAVNDLFIGPRTHGSARYLIESGGQSEQQSSSGIIVSTGLGSTGWLKSILTGATAIAGQLSHRNLTLKSQDGVPWDAPYLYFSVREPFPSRTTGATLVFGKITADHPLNLKSQMPDYGVIFSDGIEADFLDFNSGSGAKIGIAEKRGMLVI